MLKFYSQRELLPSLNNGIFRIINGLPTMRQHRQQWMPEPTPNNDTRYSYDIRFFLAAMYGYSNGSHIQFPYAIQKFWSRGKLEMGRDTKLDETKLDEATWKVVAIVITNLYPLHDEEILNKTVKKSIKKIFC